MPDPRTRAALLCSSTLLCGYVATVLLLDHDVGRWHVTLAGVAVLSVTCGALVAALLARVARRADPADRRRAILGLTRAGRRLDVEAAGTIESVVKATLAAPASTAASAMASGEARSASRSISRDLEMSQFWQNLHARLQPAVPNESTLEPG